MPKKINNTNRTGRGAPEGNQYARKHGFYSRVLDVDEQMDFEQATCVEGLDNEIALLRTQDKIRFKARPGKHRTCHDGIDSSRRAGKNQVQHRQRG
jgi:hypothetical protein